MLPDLSRLCLAPTAVGVPLPRGQELRKAADSYDLIEMIAVQLFDADIPIGLVLPAEDDTKGREDLLADLKKALTLKQEFAVPWYEAPSDEDQIFLRSTFAEKLVQELEDNRSDIDNGSVFAYDVVHAYLQFLQQELVPRYNFVITPPGFEDWEVDAPPRLPDEVDDAQEAVARMRLALQENRRRILEEKKAAREKRSAAAKKAAATRRMKKEAQKAAMHSTTPDTVVRGEVEVIAAPEKKKKIMSQLGGVAGMGVRIPERP